MPDTAAIGARTIRVAVASGDGATVDLHFGQTEDFMIFDVGAAGGSLQERRNVAERALEGENSRDTVCRILADCSVLLVSKIGISPQEKLAQAGIAALDLHAGKTIEAALAEIYRVQVPNEDLDRPLDVAGFGLSHVMLRIADLPRSLDFYTRLLGMTVFEQRDHAKNQFTQVRLGYGADGAAMGLELVFNWNQEGGYGVNGSFGHVALRVTDITALCARLAAQGVPLPRPPRSQRHGDTIVAFVEDPDGHRIKLMQAPDQG